MTHSRPSKASLMFVAMLSMALAQAALTQTDFSVGTTGITALHKTDKAACASQAGKAKVDAALAKRDADDRVAIEKRDALAANATQACAVSARSTPGKT